MDIPYDHSAHYDASYREEDTTPTQDAGGIGSCVVGGSRRDDLCEIEEVVEAEIFGGIHVFETCCWHDSQDAWLRWEALGVSSGKDNA